MNYKALLFVSLTAVLPASAQAQSQQEINQCIQTQCTPITLATEAAIQSCVESGAPENECVREHAPDGEAAVAQCEASCQSN
jgi:hypothetical protein